MSDHKPHDARRHKRAALHLSQRLYAIVPRLQRSKPLLNRMVEAVHNGRGVSGQGWERTGGICLVEVSAYRPVVCCGREGSSADLDEQEVAPDVIGRRRYCILVSCWNPRHCFSCSGIHRLVHAKEQIVEQKAVVDYGGGYIGPDQV